MAFCFSSFLTFVANYGGYTQKTDAGTMFVGRGRSGPLSILIQVPKIKEAA